MEDNLTFQPNRISALRQGLGLSVEEFAERLGVSRQTVYDWESGEREPSLANLLKIVNITRAKLENFFTSDPKTDKSVR